MNGATSSTLPRPLSATAPSSPVAVVRDGGNAVLGARTEAHLAKTAVALDPDGAHTAYRATDITDETQCEALAALAVERFGRIDAVVHVAAWDSYFGGLQDADFATWQSVIDVNLLGTLRMTRACLPSLRTCGGSVVFIGTQSRRWPRPPRCGRRRTRRRRGR